MNITEYTSCSNSNEIPLTLSELGNTIRILKWPQVEVGNACMCCQAYTGSAFMRKEHAVKLIDMGWVFVRAKVFDHRNDISPVCPNCAAIMFPSEVER